jgi:damage-control phosphatase, subfamily I
MYLQPECKQCLIKQAESTARLSGANDELIAKISKEATSIVDAAPPKITAPELAATIFGKIREYTGVLDPFLEIKKKSLEGALSIYPEIAKKVEASKDRLRASLVASAVGNVIDFGIPGLSFSPQSIVDEYENLTFEIDDYEQLKDELSQAKKILYVADNAGEIVLDRFFLEWMKANLEAEVVFAVRGGPIINDALLKDAMDSGIFELAEIIDTGLAIPGALLKLASKNFMKVYDESDLVISKGQGNYEVLEGVNKNIFFILKAKCDVIAKFLSVKLGSLVLKKELI